MATRGAAGLGLGLAVLASGTFGTSGSFASSLMASGWSPGAAVTARIGMAAVALTVPAVLNMRGRWGLLRANLPAIAAYGLVAVGGCQLFYFNAVEHVSVSVALLLEYSGTVLVVLWMWLVHGHTPRRRTVLGGALAITGLVLVLDLTGTQRVDLVGVLWGLGAAAGLAVFFVVSARTNDSLPPVVMAWAGMVVGAVTLGVFGAARLIDFRAGTADVTIAGHRTSWLVPVLELSLVAAALAYIAGIEAARRLGARLASFVGLTEVLFATLFAWLLLGQRPSLLQAVGGFIVLAGIALVRTDDEPPLPSQGSEDQGSDLVTTAGTPAA
jgi:drug/metabolite transporter (DMT)-like permease